MESLRQIFINNLRHFRNERNIRQLDLALAIGKSSNYINSIENGKYFPSPETIEQIADCLQIDPMQLFDRNGCKENFLKNHTESYADRLAENLYARLKDDLQSCLRKSIAEAL
ncbi:MAG: helix-turn-helix transcriptional regulator [Treponema sp.]|nr:helix-turn-helix transcriptional regulator [Treponema sp.]